MNIMDSVRNAVSPTSRDAMEQSLTAPEQERESDIDGRALGCLEPESAFRLACYQFFKSRWTGALVMIGILMNVVVLALQGPRHTLGVGFDHFVDAFDVCLTILFTLEALAGSCALGFISGDKAYLRDPWNVLDFSVLVGIMVSYIVLWVSDTNFEVGAVRAFRALRPLRSLRLFAGLHGILDALAMTLPYVMSILVMLIFFLMIFSTAGIALFGGALVTECDSQPLLCRLPQIAVALRGAADASCSMAPAQSSDSVLNSTSWEEVAQLELKPVVCPINFECEQCSSIPLSGSGAYGWDGEYGFDRWLENQYIGFDNVLQACLTLFVVTTMDEWTLVSHRLWASSADTAGTAWTFVTMVVLCLALITANLFVAVVVFGFGKMRKEQKKSAFTGEDWEETVAQKKENSAETGSTSHRLDELNQKQYSQYLDLQPFPFLAGASPMLHKIVQSNVFELLIIGVIVANAVAMASEYHGMSNTHKDLLLASEIFFLFVFTVEMFMKWFGLGLGLSSTERANKMGYFQDTFNCFDFMLVFVSYVGLIIDSMAEGASSGRVVRIIFRMFRIARLLRLMKGQSSLYMLLQTVLSSWEAIANLCVFIIFTIVVFAVIGMHTMGFMCHEDGGEIPRVNLASFGDAMMTCFQVMTGEDWAPIMYYYMHCSSPVGAAAYFTLLCATTSFVLLSLFVAVILENFALADEAKKQMQRDKYEDNMQQQDKGLGDVYGRSLLQQRCKNLAEQVWFERFILATIVISSLTMALEKPPQAELDDSNQAYADFLEVCGFGFLAIFVVECAIKITGNGFVGHDSSYWSDPWNRLDFSVVVLGLIDIVVYAATGTQSSVTRIFRLFRVLRPLRLIKRNAGMTVIVNSLISCLPMVYGVVALISLLFVMFAIVGMNLFMGMFFSCAEDPLNGPVLANATLLDKLQCDESGGVWDNHNFYNFDNVFEAFKTLFIVSTTEGWVTVQQTAFDIPSELDGAPIQDNNPSAAWFFVPFMVFSAFFSANLFIGVLANYFGRSSGNTLLTSRQRQWVQMHMLSMQLQPDPVIPPTNGFRLVCYKFAMHKSVETIVSSAIIANTLTLMAEHYPMDSGLITAFDSVNMIFLIIFTLELVIKLIGMGGRGYFNYSNWNRLDASIVFLSWFAYAAEGLSVFSGGRALRVLRLLLLLRNTSTLQTLLRTLILSLPPAMNITTLLVLVLFVFGIIGIQLFGGLAQGAVNVAAINEYDNFDSIVPAMRVLFQIATGQDFVWKAEELQVKMEAAGYFGQELVMPYMVVYYITSVFIFLNLFVAVLLENFELNFDPDALDVKPADLDFFKEAWERHAPTPQATHISINDVRDLVKDLHGVLGEIVMTDKLWWNHLLVKLDWDIAEPLTPDNTAGFHQLLLALALMHVSLDALPLDERVKAAAEFKQQQEVTAVRMIRACAAAYLRIKHPERYIPEDLKQAHRRDKRGLEKKFKCAACFARDIMIMQIASVSKIKSMDKDSELDALVELQMNQKKHLNAKLLSTDIEPEDKQSSKQSRRLQHHHPSKDLGRAGKKEPMFVANPMLEQFPEDGQNMI